MMPSGDNGSASFGGRRCVRRYKSLSRQSLPLRFSAKHKHVIHAWIGAIRVDSKVGNVVVWLPRPKAQLLEKTGHCC